MTRMKKITRKESIIYAIIIVIGIFFCFGIKTVTQTPYVCWTYINSSSNYYSYIHPLMSIKKSTYSYQKNLIFTNKNMTSIYWYQFAINYKTNNGNGLTNIEFEKWKSNSSLNGASIIYGYKKAVNLNIKYLQNITYKISNNIINVTFKSINQSYSIIEPIPNGEKLTNSTSENNSILNNIGFYSSNTYNLEFDIYNESLYHKLEKSVNICESFNNINNSIYWYWIPI